MLRVAITLEGQDKAAAAFRSLGRAAQGRARAAALERAAARVADRTRRSYLSGQMLGVITGELRASIEIDAADLPSSISVGTRHPGAGALHFGRRHAGGPSPFLAAALEDELPRFPDLFADAIRAEIEREAGR